MDVSFNGIGEKLVTFTCGKAEKGQVVKVDGAGAVAPCGDGDTFDGVAALVDDGFAGVLLRGFTDVTYSGKDLSVGHNALVADGNGGVKVDDGKGKDYLTVAVDTAAQVATILM